MCGILSLFVDNILERGGLLFNVDSGDSFMR